MGEVKYKTIVPGLTHFDCERIHATLSTKSCAARWAEAMTRAVEGRCSSCKRCPIGRTHHTEVHGESELTTEPHQERSVLCVRCGRPATRLVRGEICVSCFNRIREHQRGVNGRGNAPIEFVAPTPRRVGVLGESGAPTWTIFEASGQSEAVARAVLAGHRLHDQAPGRTAWDAERGEFVYVDEHGRTLAELDVDGRTETFAVDRVRAGEAPMPVTMPTTVMTTEEAQVWLTISTDADHIARDWHATDLGCARCKAGVIHARRKDGHILTRCSAGCT